LDGIILNFRLNPMRVSGGVRLINLQNLKISRYISHKDEYLNSVASILQLF